MNDLIEITNEMTSSEKRTARAHNRSVMYAQMEKEDKERIKIEMTSEEEAQAKQMIREMLRKALPELDL